MEMIRDKMDVLFEELVPPSGKCDSLAGEIIRALRSSPDRDMIFTISVESHGK